MKKVSILLVLFLTLSASPVYSVGPRESCPDILFHLAPCVGEIFNLIGLKRPISDSCCSRILNVADFCPRVFWPFGFIKAQKSCIISNVTTPPPEQRADRATTPPPAPPSNGTDTGTTPPPAPSKQIRPAPSPPSNGGYQPPCPDLDRLRPCAIPMFDYYKDKSPISSSCCTLIIDVRDKCNPRDWSDFFIQSQNHCLNQH